MFSCARPARLASSCSVNSAALMMLSSSSTCKARRSTISVMTCQASGESRSRNEIAVRWADRTSDSAEPNLSGLCSASAITRAGFVRVACEVAPHVTSSRWMRSTECSVGVVPVEALPLPGSRTDVPSALISRSVASARSR